VTVLMITGFRLMLGLISRPRAGVILKRAILTAIFGPIALGVVLSMLTNMSPFTMVVMLLSIAVAGGLFVMWSFVSSGLGLSILGHTVALWLYDSLSSRRRRE